MKTERVTSVPPIEDMYSVVAITPEHGYVEVRGYIRKGESPDPLKRSEFRNNVLIVREPGGFARFFGDTIEKRIRWAADEMRRRTFREIRKRKAQKEKEERLEKIVKQIAGHDG